MLTLCHGLKFDGGCGGCHTLPLGIYERMLLIRATYELVQKQAMPRLKQKHVYVVHNRRTEQKVTSHKILTKPVLLMINLLCELRLGLVTLVSFSSSFFRLLASLWSLHRDRQSGC